MRFRLALLLFATAVAAAAAGRWTVCFFHDQDHSRFDIIDMTFSSSRYGIAVGMLVRDNGKTKPMSVVTRDGGRNWSYRELKEMPISVFFLSDANGWLVTADGIWTTDEGGLSWRKISAPNDVLRVFFLNENRGFAVGRNKTVLSTADGGKTWSAVPAAAKPNTTRAYTTYNWIEFVTPRVGIITGRSKRPEPPHFGRLEAEDYQRPEHPSLSILLETRDGGETWTPETTSIFGAITRVRMQRRSTRALGLIEFEHLFMWPSEVMRIDTGTGLSRHALARKDLAVTDIELSDDGIAYAFGYEARGVLGRSPVPSRVRILESRDLENWTEADVDYRAVATRVVSSALDSQHVWVACDTGMILQLEPN